MCLGNSMASPIHVHTATCTTTDNRPEIGATCNRLQHTNIQIGATYNRLHSYNGTTYNRFQNNNLITCNHSEKEATNYSQQHQATNYSQQRSTNNRSNETNIQTTTCNRSGTRCNRPTVDSSTTKYRLDQYFNSCEWKIIMMIIMTYALAIQQLMCTDKYQNDIFYKHKKAKYKHRRQRKLRKRHRTTCSHFYSHSPKRINRVCCKQAQLTAHLSYIAHQDNVAYVGAKCTKIHLTKSPDQHCITFDSDSYDLICDGGASKCISNDSNHFIGSITAFKKPLYLKGIDGSIPIKGFGTIKWSIMDDEGNNHVFHIKKALYVPSAPKCLFSPQHWAASYPRQDPSLEYHATIRSTSTILHWDGFNRTISHHPTQNIAIIPTSPSFFSQRCRIARVETALSATDSYPSVAYMSPHLIPDDDDEYVSLPPP